MLDDENWDEIKKLRKRMRFKSGRIRNLDGELVDRSEKAETLAQYFTKIQWQVQFPDCLPSHLPNTATELPNNTDDISHEELVDFDT